MSSPTIGVLALQGDVREHLRALEAAGARACAVRRPAELDALDGIVIPGGESTTIGKLALIFGMYQPLRDGLAAGLPAYGSCAGMIMLAETIRDGRPDQVGFGGIDMAVRRNAFGRQVDSFEVGLDVKGVPGGPVHAVFIRAPWVESVGPAVQVLASVPAEGLHRVGPSQPDAADPAAAIGRIVAVRQGALLATAFHPELTGDARIHELFVRLVKQSEDNT